MPDPIAALKELTTSLDSMTMSVVQKSGGFWSNAVPRGTYALGQGLTQTTTTIERLEPVSDSDTGYAVTLDNAGDPDYAQVTPGYTNRTYSPKKIPLKGPLFNRERLKYEHDFAGFLSGYVKKLGNFADKKWALAMRYNYVLTGGLMIARDEPSGEITEAGVTWPTSTDATPEYEASFDLLDTLAAELIERNSGEPDEGGLVVEGSYGPVWPVEIGIEMLRKMLHNDPDRREDLRAVKSDALFTRLGATQALGNFRFMPTTSPLRFKIVTNQLVNVPKWIEADATGGKKSIRNPDYNDPSIAAYEAIIPFSPTVMEADIVPPITSAGGVTWGPKSHMGKWAFVNDGDKLHVTFSNDGTDPFNDWGQHFCEFEYAIKPKSPDQGLTLLVKRDASAGSYVQV